MGEEQHLPAIDADVDAPIQDCEFSISLACEGTHKKNIQIVLIDWSFTLH